MSGNRSVSANFSQDQPQIEVSPSGHGFGTVLIGDSLERTYGVRNVGSGLLTGSVSVQPPFVVISGQQFTDLPPSASHAVVVRFEPDSVGGVTRTVQFESNGGSASATAWGRGSPISFDRMYFNQAVPVQDTSSSPTERLALVANRDALLRIFATSVIPQEVVISWAFATFWRDGTEVGRANLAGPGSVPMWTDEGDLATTYDMFVPGSWLQSGVGVEIIFDASVDGVVDRYVFRDGTSAVRPLQITTVPDADFTLVPVTAMGYTGGVGDQQALLSFTRKVFPLGDDTIDIAVRAPYSFDGDLALRSEWSRLLRELDSTRSVEGSQRQWYGLINVSGASSYPLLGLGYVGHPVAIGVDYLPTASRVAAHEIGHNWNQWHVDCGNPGDVDPNYPYANGSIGVWGYDTTTSTLLSPFEYSDLMSYCSPKWISDYIYGRVMQYRAASAAMFPASIMPGDEVLVVSGYVDQDHLVLDPLFVTEGASSPISDGPYVFVAYSDSGAEVVRRSFEVREISTHGSRVFAFTVPVPSGSDAALGRVVVERAGVTLLERTARARPLALRATEVARLPDGAMRVVWDRVAFEAVLVRDGVGGPVLGQGRRGPIIVQPTGRELELVFSDGLNTVREVVRP